MFSPDIVNEEMSDGEIDLDCLSYDIAQIVPGLTWKKHLT